MKTFTQTAYIYINLLLSLWKILSFADSANGFFFFFRFDRNQTHCIHPALSKEQFIHGTILKFSFSTTFFDCSAQFIDDTSTPLTSLRIFEVIKCLRIVSAFKVLAVFQVASVSVSEHVCVIAYVWLSMPKFVNGAK